MANPPDDRPTSSRVTPKGGPTSNPPATKAAARKAEAAKRSEAVSKAARPTARKVDPAARVSGAKPSDAKVAARSGDPKKKAAAQSEQSRYTAPIPNSYKISPWWIPALMFGFLGVGMLIIILNYANWPFGDPSNWRLLGGLACILAGILVATRYQ